MSNLPIVHMTLYKHGVGYYRRQATVEGQAIKLTFRREEMDDLLKSLTVIDHGEGQVRGVDYDTPQSQAERLAGCSVILGDARSTRDLLDALRGRAVALQLSDGSQVAGQLLGLDEPEEKPLETALVSLLEADSDTVAVLPLSRLEAVTLQDETAAADLRFFLQTALGQETHRSITIRLSPGSHDLEVSYVAPAPTWRVSYRLVLDAPETDNDDDAAEQKPEALIQGWGIFDNRLEEDLTEISLSLTAGMPISFVYDLYTPHTPERPKVKDEKRTVAGPILFDAAVEKEEESPAEPMGSPASVQSFSASSGMRRTMRRRSRVSAETMADSVTSAATGRARGELFQYNVSHPVTVGRGQSAMVPIVSSRLQPRKDLIYNRAKLAVHPVATLRFENSTGLTLERGPVTVLENGEYVGEAVLPFTVAEAEAVVSYAVELGIHIKEDHKSETHLRSLEIRDSYLIRQVYDIRRTVYQIDNRTAQAKTVLLERPISSAYEPFDSPEPAEKTVDARRYRVQAGPGRVTKFTVQERRLHAQQEQLSQQSYQHLQRYFEGKFLDKQTYERLKELLDTWAEINDLQKTIKQANRRRAKIYQSQEQIQKNMAALSNEGEEGRLRGRYVKQLVQSEEELTEIKETISQAEAQIEQKQAQIEQMIAALNR